MVPQAPVLAPLKGSLQGTQRWPAAQLPVSSVGWAETAGRHVERHRPGAEVPSNATQFSGSTWPPARMRSSGAQRPALAAPPPAARCAAEDGGTDGWGGAWEPRQDGALGGVGVGAG